MTRGGQSRQLSSRGDIPGRVPPEQHLYNLFIYLMLLLYGEPGTGVALVTGEAWPNASFKEETMTTMRGTLTGVLAAAAILACPVQSQASGVHVGIVFSGGDHRDYRDRNDTYRLGFERGSHEGWRQGYEDGRRNRHYGYADDRGYRSQYGSRRLYATGYRRGYEDAYRRGFAQGRRQSHGYRDRDRDRDWDRDRDRDGRHDDDWR